jgi:hypothetical protein
MDRNGAGMTKAPSHLVSGKTQNNMLVLRFQAAQGRTKQSNPFQPPDLTKKRHGHGRTGSHMGKRKQVLIPNQLKQGWDILGEVESVGVTEWTENSIKQK